MKTFNVEVIHESTGTFMNFQYETDNDSLTADNIWEEILADLSVVAFEEE